MDKKIKSYFLVLALNPEELSKAVNKYIEEGWQPFGSPQFERPAASNSPIPGAVYWAQAIVMY